MIDERLDAVRRLRFEADNLQLACTEISGTKAMLHIAYDREAQPSQPIQDVVLLGHLRAIP